MPGEQRLQGITPEFMGLLQQVLVPARAGQGCAGSLTQQQRQTAGAPVSQQERATAVSCLADAPQPSSAAPAAHGAGRTLLQPSQLMPEQAQQ